MALPPAALTERFTAITPLQSARGRTPGEPLGELPPSGPIDALREAVPDVRAAITASGMADAIATCDLVTLPYPTRFGLWRAATTSQPFLWITNRMLVVQWDDADGSPRTLLWEASDHERGEFTPYFAGLIAGDPLPTPGLTTIAKLSARMPRRAIATIHGTVLTSLAALGIAPADVDYLAFDHLHTQDVRRLIGTTRPAPDLGTDEPLPGWFPNATLVTQAREWAALANLHPFQRPWYQPDTYADLPTERIALVDGDVLLGPGVALVATPGHTAGNQSLVLNTPSGLWTSSENGISVDNWSPHASRINGVRAFAVAWGQEVVVNANTPEYLAWQYDSMIIETLIADATPDGDFRQVLPSSELTATRLAPGLRATRVHGGIHHGGVRRSTTEVPA